MKRESLEVFEEMLTSYPSLAKCKADIMRAFEIMEETYKYGKILLICGNGGSSSDAEHIVGELMKGFKKKRRIEPNPMLDESIRTNLSEGLPAICLSSHTSLITAIGNDSSYEMIYAQQAYAYRKLAGAILCLSTSGNARNVNNAAITARACRIPVIGMTGELGGYLNSLADVCIKVPESETYKVQELHLPVYHCLCAMLECEFFEN
ncbi:MAG: SIS domain-containing protein [Clostridia bacterium]|jgi:D-sedoheptulose 7-phosphate isomerase|nr:SIS domain-containing protein [Clostridia bacterium]NLV32907.1 SIS domain-containing protein [Clostridiaceae bacterium]HPB17683.1 SIS domain-containing protein [Clostridia bacterium]HQM97488.1 SIS domain-containing protein [Clostridia bacterium]HQO70618.1 SIS domain-containing protein [Clostridia bacterium]